jgi:hypothetical protein
VEVEVVEVVEVEVEAEVVEMQRRRWWRWWRHLEVGGRRSDVPHFHFFRRSQTMAGPGKKPVQVFAT